MHRIALTSGEPAGIGPDLVIMQAQSARDDEIVAIGDPDLLHARAKELDLSLSLRVFDATATPQGDVAGSLCVLPVPVAATVSSGQLDPLNAPYVLPVSYTHLTLPTILLV